jgi:indole-3-glycerol phosphate synthase
VPTYLDAILRAHRATASRDQRALGDLLARAAALPPARGFARALRAAEGVAVIAECKRRSPSKGDLAPDLDPADLAVRYERGGASCLSVLTDADHFGGSPDDLQSARAACSLPVLRKDFTVDERDVVDARLMGADAVLLIVAALSDDELGRFLGLAGDLGLDALVEVHDEPELERALAAGATLIGANSRDLHSFEVDVPRAAALAGRMPAGTTKVFESGIRTAADVALVRDAGWDAVLVGEALVTSDDPSGALRELLGLGSAPCS